MVTDPTPIRVILGSASQGRLRVLRAAGLDPDVEISDVDEDAIAAALGDDAAPETVVARLASAKTDAVATRVMGSSQDSRNAVVIGCDSMLLVDGQLFGKPHVADVARAQWRSVRGRSAQLLTGHCVARIVDGAVVSQASDTSATTVRFADIDDDLIDAYVATGEPLEVAGGFTLDGLGGWLIDGVDGDPSAVIGIGLPLVRRLFAEVGVQVSELWSS